MRNQNAGVWAGFITFIFGLVIFVQSLSLEYYGKFGPGPGLFPLWLSLILIALSASYIVISMKKKELTFGDILPKGKKLRKLIIIAAALVGFKVIVPLVGFIIAATLFLLLLLAQVYRWYVNVGISIGVSVFLYWVFDILLAVPLPVNAFGF